MGWNRQAYYQQIKAGAALHERDAQVVELVREVRRWQPRIGVRKLHHMLRRRCADKRIKLGRDGMFATLKRAHLLVPTARAYHKTTDSFHRFYKHPNLLKAGLTMSDYNQERPHQALKYKTPDEIHRALQEQQERALLAAYNSQSILGLVTDIQIRFAVIACTSIAPAAVV